MVICLDLVQSSMTDVLFQRWLLFAWLPTDGGAMFWITRVGHFFDVGDGCATKCEARVSIFVGGGLVGERLFG